MGRVGFNLLGAGCLLMGAGLVSGCLSSKGQGPVAVSETMADVWEPAVRSIRIYPSTRFVTEAGQPLLEARVELFDEMGDSIKSSGSLRFELFAAGHAPGIEVGRLLYSWDVSLLSLEDQQRYYDPITRGYLFRLRLDSAEVTRREVLLRATVQPPTGERMVDEKQVLTGF